MCVLYNGRAISDEFRSKLSDSTVIFCLYILSYLSVGRCLPSYVCYRWRRFDSKLANLCALFSLFILGGLGSGHLPCKLTNTVMADITTSSYVISKQSIFIYWGDLIIE